MAPAVERPIPGSWHSSSTVSGKRPPSSLAHLAGGAVQVAGAGVVAEPVSGAAPRPGRRRQAPAPWEGLHEALEIGDYGFTWVCCSMISDTHTR